MRCPSQGFRSYGGSFADEQGARQAAISLYNRLFPEGPQACIRHSGTAASLSDSHATDEPEVASESLHQLSLPHSDSEDMSDADLADDSSGSQLPLPASGRPPALAPVDRSRRLAAQGSASSKPAQRTQILACPKVRCLKLRCGVQVLHLHQALQWAGDF